MLLFPGSRTPEAGMKVLPAFEKREPPTGVTLLGRWTRADFSGRFDLLETEDAKALAEFALMWSDLMDLTIVPVLEDQPLSEVLNRISH